MLAANRQLLQDVDNKWTIVTICIEHLGNRCSTGAANMQLRQTHHRATNSIFIYFLGKYLSHDPLPALPGFTPRWEFIIQCSQISEIPTSCIPRDCGVLHGACAVSPGWSVVSAWRNTLKGLVLDAMGSPEVGWVSFNLEDGWWCTTNWWVCGKLHQWEDKHCSQNCCFYFIKGRAFISLFITGVGFQDQERSSSFVFISIRLSQSKTLELN